MPRSEVLEQFDGQAAAVAVEVCSLWDFARRVEQLGQLSKHSFTAGELICSSGDQLGKLHFLEQGIVELCQLGEMTNCSVLLLSAGDLLFPAAAIFDEPCLTSARALTSVQTIALETDAVRAEALRNPMVAMDLSAVVSGQWRMAVRHILDIRCRSVPQRLAGFLLRLVDESRLPDRAELPFSKSALAARLGASPETLSRAIQTIAKQGLLIRGREIVVRDRKLIERFCEPSLYPGSNEWRLRVHAY